MPPAPSSRLSRIANLVGGGVIAAVLAAGTAEVAVRVADPTPRAQIVDLDAVRAIGGTASWEGAVPMWAEPDARERQAMTCPEGSRVVLLVGSSITHGAGLPDADAPHTRLQAALDASGTRWCVVDVSQSGFSIAQKEIAVTRGLERWHPALVLLEVWQNDPNPYVRIGDLAVSTTSVHVDDDGLPLGPLPLPRALHHRLLERSAAWRYATLALATTDRDRNLRQRDAELPEALARIDAVTAAAHATLVVWTAPAFSLPFAAQSADVPDTWYTSTFRWARGAGVTVIDVADAWRGRTPADVGIDACCHLSRAGVDAWTTLVAPVVRDATVSPAP